MLLTARLQGQDASTGALRWIVFDPSGGQIAGASIVVVNAATGFRYSVTSDAEGRFALELLPPGDYSARADALDVSPQLSPPFHVEVGGTAVLEFRLALVGTKETVTVSGAPALVDTQPSAISALIDERAICQLSLYSMCWD